MNQPNLPVRAVTLFSSGVAYTQREGAVEAGEAQVSLTFRTSQINDILKSLILLDEGGTALPVVYPSQDPVERTLKSFAVDVTGFTTRGELLRLLRGVPVRVETISQEHFEGQVLAVETEQQVRGEKSVVAVESLCLATATGLVTVALDKVRVLQILDERRDKELREALSVLAAGADDARRTIQLRFDGKKKRAVQVGYITEAPLWKISYRLVLDNAQKPFIQGWSLVENTTDEDWEGVHLRLVSGRPVSFVQDLYQPQYLERPVVADDIITAPPPVRHEAMLQSYAKRAAPMMAPTAAPAPASAFFDMDLSADLMQQSVSSQAEGTSVGELFVYEITAPVSLPRQQAAMIPVLSGDINGEKLSLYNADRDPRFPLNAVRLINDTGLHLKAGPITVFDGGTYAGDARMEEIPPSDTRLITYAVDLAIEGERQSLAPKATVRLAVQRGVLRISSQTRRETLYRLRNKSDRERTVLVEHPFAADWTLTAPTEATERTAQLYRFQVTVPPGDAAELPVTVERTDASAIGLLQTGIDVLVQYSNAEPSPRLKEALTVVIARRRKINEWESVADGLDQERGQIHQEQERIRGNLATVDKDAALYRRYLEELNVQENRLLELREEANRLRQSARTALDELRAYLDTLEIDA